MSDELTYYLRAFPPKWRHTHPSEIVLFDQMWSGMEGHFKKIADNEGLNEKQKIEFLRIMYKVLFVKREYDERYDNVLVGRALDRVRRRKYGSNQKRKGHYTEI